jgi:hypothetical protein
MCEHLPLLTAHLASLGVEPSQPLPGWLLGGFASSSMPFETVARLWDVAFLERSSAPLVRCPRIIPVMLSASYLTIWCCLSFWFRSKLHAAFRGYQRLGCPAGCWAALQAAACRLRRWPGCGTWPSWSAPQHHSSGMRVLSAILFVSDLVSGVVSRIWALCLSGWLLGGLVSSSMPFETVARLWDVAFLEHSSATLVRCAGVVCPVGPA